MANFGKEKFPRSLKYYCSNVMYETVVTHFSCLSYAELSFLSENVSIDYKVPVRTERGLTYIDILPSVGLLLYCHIVITMLLPRRFQNVLEPPSPSTTPLLPPTFWPRLAALQRVSEAWELDQQHCPFKRKTPSTAPRYCFSTTVSS